MEAKDFRENLIAVPPSKQAIWRYINRDEFDDICTQAGIGFRQAMNHLNGRTKRPHYQFFRLLTQKMEANKSLIDRYNKLVSK